MRKLIPCTFSMILRKQFVLYRKKRFKRSIFLKLLQTSLSENGYIIVWNLFLKPTFLDYLHVIRNKG